MTSRFILLGILALLTPLITTAATSAPSTAMPKDALNKLSEYNVTWDSPSLTGSLESMPLGNGDITANVWVEKDGDLMMYIGKSDTWSEATRLLKIGRVRVSISPNPFTETSGYRQTLDLADGTINITAGPRDNRTDIKIWIDANAPVVNVETSSSRPVEVKFISENMRPEAVTFNGGGSHPLASSYRGLMDSPIAPSESADIFVPSANRVEWYHRNVSSFYPTILERQNVGELTSKYPDPYINRTFGAAITGDGMIAANDSTLTTSAPRKKTAVRVVALTSQCDDLAQWQEALDSLIAEAESRPLNKAYREHCGWWHNFWGRSWIFLSGDDDARTITEAYLLQRYMMACQSRGAYPVKFNGGTLTFDYNGNNGDYRNWGPGYWYQNCRLYYWPLAASGDFDMKKPWFDMYMSILPMQQDITRIYYGHDGAFFPETLNFFGLYIQDDWGWNNTGKASQTRWIRYHYEGALEMLAEMLDYYDHTRDEAFARDYIVPFATQVIRFFDLHWPTINNQYRFIPANALEQYWDCLNPTDYIAGLTHDITRLRELPDGIVPAELSAEWERILTQLPPIARTPDGSRLLPAEEYGVDRNFENPQCYAIFPFRLYGPGRLDPEVARNTFDSRIFKESNCWSQCGIQAAILGLDEMMPAMLMRNATARDPQVRFPSFWKPGSDYVPDLDNGGVLALTLQHMLIDNNGDSIVLLQAMPEHWNVDFKLHAHDRTSVRVKANGKNINSLDVWPESRRNDISVK